MRISTPLMFERGVSAMTDKQRELSKTELQLATGKRILAPSDDPAATARILDLNREIETVTQHQRNISRAKSRLELEDATLGGAVNLLQRARELAVQGGNDTLSTADRTSIAYELEQIRDELLRLANTRDANGEYIFSGFQGDAAAYSLGPPAVYNGDANQRQIRISYDRTLADGDPGPDVFGGAGVTAFDNLQALIDDLKLGNSASPHLSTIDTDMGRILDVRAKAGARLNAIDKQEQVNADFILTLETTRSGERDLDYAEAVSRFQQQLTALQASQQSFLKIQDLSLFKFL